MFKLLCAMFVLATLVSPQAALAKSNIDKAKDYAKIEKTSEARQLLNQAILDDPLDADVHYEAGLVYGQLGMSSDFDLAMKNACKLETSYCPKVAQSYLSSGNNSLSNPRSAERFYQLASKYDQSLSAGIATTLLNRGKAASADQAGKYFSAALGFTGGDKETKTLIGNEFLKLAAKAWPNYDYKVFKAKAVEILGKEQVFQVFPKPYDKVVFENTVTNANPKSGEWTPLYVWDSRFRKGDLIEIFTDIQKGEDPVCVNMGKGFSPEWISIKNNYYRSTVKNVPHGRNYSVYLSPELNVTARVKVTRRIKNPEPNLGKLAGL